MKIIATSDTMGYTPWHRVFTNYSASFINGRAVSAINYKVYSPEFMSLKETIIKLVVNALYVNIIRGFLQVSCESIVFFLTNRGLRILIVYANC